MHRLCRGSGTQARYRACCVKLLFDENLSPKLPRRLAELFPDSSHVRDVNLKSAGDPVVWRYAKDNDFTIVSKDSDLHQRSFWSSAKTHLGETRQLFDVRARKIVEVELWIYRRFPYRRRGIISSLVLGTTRLSQV